MKLEGNAVNGESKSVLMTFVLQVPRDGESIEKIAQEDEKKRQQKNPVEIFLQILRDKTHFTTNPFGKVTLNVTLLTEFDTIARKLTSPRPSMSTTSVPLAKGVVIAVIAAPSLLEPTIR